jgi:hypothetical protein
VNLKIKTLSYDTRVKAFWTLAALSTISLVIYMVGVMLTIHHTVARQNLQDQVSTLTTEVSNLEFQYIALQNGLTLNLAYSRGFEDVTNPLYISRAAESSLSFNVQAR